MPPPGLTGIDREHWLRGKREAEATKAALEQQRKAEEIAPEQIALTKRPRLIPSVSWRFVFSWHFGRGAKWAVAVGALLVFCLACLYSLVAIMMGWLLFATAVLLTVWCLATGQLPGTAKHFTSHTTWKSLFETRDVPRRPVERGPR